MAHHASAQKQMRQSQKRRARNRQNISQLKTQVKKLRSAIAKGDAEAAKKLLPETVGEIDKAAKKGVVHDNAAARYKGRLARTRQRPLREVAPVPLRHASASAATRAVAASDPLFIRRSARSRADERAPQLLVRPAARGGDQRVELELHVRRQKRLGRSRAGASAGRGGHGPRAPAAASGARVARILKRNSSSSTSSSSLTLSTDPVTSRAATQSASR